jgi:hypothetical protein
MSPLSRDFTLRRGRRPRLSLAHSAARHRLAARKNESSLRSQSPVVYSGDIGNTSFRR